MIPLGASTSTIMNASVEQVPDGSIYFWMYRQGRRGVPIQDVMRALNEAGVEARNKDIQNYSNGLAKLNRHNEDVFSLLNCYSQARGKSYDTVYSDFPKHPYLDEPEIEDRWVPCNKDNKPMIKWSQGCWSKVDAQAKLGQKYLAENLKGTKHIVIDIDGDHGYPMRPIDIDAIMYFMDLTTKTHCMSKPKLVYDCEPDITWDLNLLTMPVSYHLTFSVDKVIPTMHFPNAHVDVIGNQANSLRYFKNKLWNEMNPIPMTDEIWNYIMGYVKLKETGGASESV